MKSLFRYSGNKSRLLEYYKRVPMYTKRLVEPYLGSGAFLLNSSLPGLGIDINSDIIMLWTWLKTTTAKELLDLHNLVQETKKQDPNFDVRVLKLPPGPELYLRINITGMYVGQLSSWSVYPQQNLPIYKTIQCLEKVRQIELIHGDATLYKHQDGDLLFIDPPYTNTFANYKQDGKSGIEENYDPSSTIKLIESTNNPIIFTYGSNAKEVFPMYDWELALLKKVPNLRNGGTTDRFEYVTYINFPESVFTLF